MEESKLLALHESLSKLKGHQGLGMNKQYSWQRSKKEKPAVASGLPENSLYAHFLPAGTYDPNVAKADDGDGRHIKRDFSDASSDEDAEPAKKKLTKEEKKAAAKAAKLEAKRKAKLEEKKRLKKEAKKLKRQASEISEASLTVDTEAKEESVKSKKSKKKRKDEAAKDQDPELADSSKREKKKRKRDRKESEQTPGQSTDPAQEQSEVKKEKKKKRAKA